MAELLIKAVDAVHADPVKDKCGCYKRGDVVVAKADGWAWGKEEGLPAFCILKITDLSVKAAQKYIESETLTEVHPNDPTDMITSILCRRQYHVCMDELPAATLSALDADGIATTDWPSVCGCVEDKVTGARET